MLDKIDILSLDLENLQNAFTNLGLKKYNANQVYEWLHKKMEFEFDNFSNLSKINRELLKKHFYLSKLEYKEHQISVEDNTEKFLFELHDKRLIETVLIGHKNRYTICISSQIGCLLKCDFCATALMNYERNLEVSEILLQYYFIEKYLKEKNETLSNVVFMGMGEPFLNYENVIKSINMLNSSLGLNISKRNFTISTSGIVPAINKFMKDEPQVNLAVSLHSVKDSIRSKIMPINNKYPLMELKNALIDYQRETKNRITFEYILIDELNCSKKDAFDLISFLRSFSSLINLIPYNPVIGKDYKAPQKKKQKDFYNILKEKNISVTLRETKGNDIAAACGQLKAKKEMDDSE